MADTHRRVSGVADDLLLALSSVAANKLWYRYLRKFMEIEKVLELNSLLICRRRETCCLAGWYLREFIGVGVV